MMMISLSKKEIISTITINCNFNNKYLLNTAVSKTVLYFCD